MDSHQDYRRFLVWTVGVIAAGIIFSVAFVVIVDPYRIYGLVDTPGINHVKPRPDRYQEEIKLTGVRAIKADVLILGNSRAEIGFNPDYTGFAIGSYSAYNLAISGTSISTARRQLEYLRHIGQKPRMIILGVDFLDFLLDPSVPQVPRHALKSAYSVDEFKWKFDSIFSLTSMMDAIRTLQVQAQPEAEIVTPRGFNPLLEYKKYAHEQGYYALFQQRAMENARSYTHKPHGLVMPETGSSKDLDDLRAILTAASEESIELHVIIYPYHAQILAMFEHTGLWPVFEQWKKMLAEEVVFATQKKQIARIQLWDFSGFSTFQCEVIPPKDALAQTTQWYWEAGHFKQEFGNVILARLLDKPLGPAFTESIGFPLTTANFVENNRRIERERAACMASYPQLFSDASNLVKDARLNR